MQSGERQACVGAGRWDAGAHGRDWRRGVVKLPPFSNEGRRFGSDTSGS